MNFITKNIICLALSLSIIQLSAAEFSGSYVGDISAKELLENYSKFSTEHLNFTPENSELEQLDKLAGYDITVFFGIWCHDSQREVPRLLKLIEQSKVSLNSLRLVAINKEKQISIIDQNKFSVEFTPTIFLHKDNKIYSSMVEKPEKSIVQDLFEQLVDK